MIKFVNASKCKELVNIHLLALPDDVLTSFGKKILEDFYKKTFFDNYQKILGFSVNNKLVGFVIISRKKINLNIPLKKLLPRLFYLLFFDFSKIYSGLVQLINRYSISQNSLEISYLAVLPKFQGKGIGNSLIKNISDYRFSKVKYIVTKTSNERLKNFYVKKYKAKILSSFFSLKKYSIVRWKTNNNKI